MNIIFFGSTEDSVIVAQTLQKKYRIAAFVTQPAKPIGRTKTITKTPLELYAIKQKIPCMTFAQDSEHPWRYNNEDEVTNSLSSFIPDLFITACYGQKLPSSALALPTQGSLNIHPSLLPRWRGADPVPWTIIAGDAQTGATISLITDTFDTGDIIAVKKIPVPTHDTPDRLRTTLFTLGADLLLETLPEYIQGSIKPVPQKKEDVVVARKLTREDGYIPFSLISLSLQGQDEPREKRNNTLIQDILEPLPQAIARLTRALSPWPGVWTTIPMGGVDKRVKLIEVTVKNNKLVLTTVQLEGKNQTSWELFQTAYLT